MQYQKHYQNKPDYKQKRRRLRQPLTKAEYQLWQELRKDKLMYRFRRQFQIGKYIVDFYCHKLRLVIEIDGFVHDAQEEYDSYRQRWLESKGFTVLRFDNDDVLFDRGRVMGKIVEVCGVLAEARGLNPSLALPY